MAAWLDGPCAVFKVSGNGRERRSHTSNFWHTSVPTPRIGVVKRSRTGIPTPNFLYFNHWPGEQGMMERQAAYWRPFLSRVPSLSSPFSHLQSLPHSSVPTVPTSKSWVVNWHLTITYRRQVITHCPTPLLTHQWWVCFKIGQYQQNKKSLNYTTILTVQDKYISWPQFELHYNFNCTR